MFDDDIFSNNNSCSMFDDSFSSSSASMFDDTFSSSTDISTGFNDSSNDMMYNPINSWSIINIFHHND